MVFYSHFPRVLVQACFADYKYKMHREVHQKVLFDTELRKGMIKAPTNSTQTEQSTIEKRSRSSPKPAMRRQWLEVVVKGWLTLGGGQPPSDVSLPLHAPTVACHHAKVVKLLFHAKNSLKHHHPPCINRGVGLPSTRQ